MRNGCFLDFCLIHFDAKASCYILNCLRFELVSRAQDHNSFSVSDIIRYSMIMPVVIVVKIALMLVFNEAFFSCLFWEM